MSLGNQFADRWHKIVRNAHDSFGWRNVSLILKKGPLFGLLLVTG